MDKPQNKRAFLEKIKDGSLTEEEFDKWEKNLSKRATEEALRVLPSVVDHLTRQSFVLQKLSKKFYENNPDLVDHKQLVADTIQQAESDNPEKDYQELLEDIGPKVRGVLGMMPEKKAKKDKTIDIGNLDDQVGAL